MPEPPRQTLSPQAAAIPQPHPGTPHAQAPGTASQQASAPQPEQDRSDLSALLPGPRSGAGEAYENMENGNLLSEKQSALSKTKDYDIIKTNHGISQNVDSDRQVSEDRVYKPVREEESSKRYRRRQSKPYINSRPSFRKGVIEKVWERAKGPDGLVRDPNTNEVIYWVPGSSRKGVWDMGHISDQKYSDVHKKYLNGEITVKEFVDWYNEIENYRPELPKNNRSHKYE